MQAAPACEGCQSVLAEVQVMGLPGGVVSVMGATVEVSRGLVSEAAARQEFKRGLRVGGSFKTYYIHEVCMCDRL